MIPTSAPRPAPQGLRARPPGSPEREPQRALNPRAFGSLRVWMDEVESRAAARQLHRLPGHRRAGRARPQLVERKVLVSPTVDRGSRTVFRSLPLLLLYIPARGSAPLHTLLDTCKRGSAAGHTSLRSRTASRELRACAARLVVARGRDPVVSAAWPRILATPAAGRSCARRRPHSVNHQSPRTRAAF